VDEEATLEGNPFATGFPVSELKGKLLVLYEKVLATARRTIRYKLLFLEMKLRNTPKQAI